MLYEDVSCVLFDSRCEINCQSLCQPFAAYLVHRVKTQNIQRTGHGTKHLKHLKHIENRMLPCGSQQDTNNQVPSNIHTTQHWCVQKASAGSPTLAKASLSDLNRMLSSVRAGVSFRDLMITADTERQSWQNTTDIILHLSFSRSVEIRKVKVWPWH